MLFAYVDESERDDLFYFLGALICTASQQIELTDRLDAIVQKHAQTFQALDAHEELHGSSIMRAAERPWRSIPLRARFRIYEEALQAIESSGVRIYVEGVDIRRQVARGYAQVTPARELAFSHLFERINDCCDRAEPEVKVIADEHHTAEISRSNFARYRTVGTYGYRSSALPNILPEIDFIESRMSRSLQAADLVTYIYNRLMTVTESDVRAREQKERMWLLVEPALQWPRGRARIWP